MKYWKIKILILLMLVLELAGLQAQQVIPAAGGNAKGNRGSASYTIGQLANTTQTGLTGSVTGGVQQPFEISIISGIYDSDSINLTFSVYPNPASDIIWLKVGNYQSENLLYQLYDSGGHLLQDKTIEAAETPVFMKNLASSTYILKIIRDGREVKAFKIIKNL